jgi:thioredoxin reductase (NADPH)
MANTDHEHQEDFVLGHQQVIIIGSGPAGYTAALYAARADLSPLVIEGFLWGGLLQQTTDVENYPGFRDGIMGPDLMQTMRDQAERFGARFLTDNVTRFEPAPEEGGLHTVWVDDEAFKTRTVILAMGAEHRKLGVPGEEELANGRGVSYCATCDAAFYKDKETIVVGGGDSAMEEAIFLAKFSSKVTIVHRRDEFRASQIMFDRAKAVENIELLTPYVVEEFLPGEAGALGSARVRNVETGDARELPMSGAFVAVGHVPQSEIVAGSLETDENGYVAVDGRSTRTGLPGVFASGDLVDHTYRQAITAAGSGCQAALDAEWYLRDNPLVPTPAVLEGTGDLAEEQWFQHEPARS